VRSQLSDESIIALESLIGSTIHTIFATNLDAAGGHLAGWKLSMMLSNKLFMTFECEWQETPFFLMDSWGIKVKLAQNPLGIALNADGALIDCSHIHIYESSSIERIEVYRFADEYQRDEVAESVEFDGALVFRSQRRDFVIGCSMDGPGIATYLHFSEDARVIAELTDGAECRLVLGNLTDAISIE